MNELLLCLISALAAGLVVAMVQRSGAKSTGAFLEQAKTTMAVTQAQARGDLDQRHQAVEHLIDPLQRTLEKVEAQLHGLEISRQQAYVGLQEQVRSLAESERLLRTETGNLVTALRAPATRGRWGEIQLRRVVELAGMVPHCDFVEQQVGRSEDRVSRADVIVKLPGGSNLIVDAKVPMDAYLRSMEATSDGERNAALRDHARQLRNHAEALGAKEYWRQYQPAPDFVIMFVPGEALLIAALEHDPNLLERACEARVLITAPTTLIATLRSAAWGWRQETLAEHGREICDLGAKLYRRLSTMGDHVSKLGRSLESSVKSYNAAVGSLESSVLPAARKFDDLGVGDKSLAPLTQLETVPRAPQSPEFAGQPDQAIESGSTAA